MELFFPQAGRVQLKGLLNNKRWLRREWSAGRPAVDRRVSNHEQETHREGGENPKLTPDAAPIMNPGP